MKNYREQIIDVINNLVEARDLIFEQIVNLAMSNEFKHLEETFAEGDTYTFSLKQFENMEDVNVQQLVELCKQTEEAIFAIMDSNDIGDNEVDIDLEQ